VKRAKRIERLEDHEIESALQNLGFALFHDYSFALCKGA
jgi:hypothetical protein